MVDFSAAIRVRHSFRGGISVGSTLRFTQQYYGNSIRRKESEGDFVENRDFFSVPSTRATTTASNGKKYRRLVADS